MKNSLLFFEISYRRDKATRNDHAKAKDPGLNAPKARSAKEWLSAPNRFDLPNVDANKKS